MLYIACQFRRDDLLKVMIKGGVDVNFHMQVYRFPPLHAAAMSGGAACVKLLLRAGASVNAADVVGDTALHRACLFGKRDCIEALLNGGANWTTRNPRGHTPNDKAKSHGHIDV